MSNINQLQPDNCAMAFIDHQPFVAFPIQSISTSELINNVTGLAKAAKALNIPTILTTVSAKGGPLADPLFTQLQNVFPEIEPIDRHNTNAWSDPKFVEAIEKTGRKKLIFSGLLTEICLAQTTLSALKAGYEVFFVSDASGGVSLEAHHDAKLRMIQAGAQPLNWMAVMSELSPDNAVPEFQKIIEITGEHGGGERYNVEYLQAQMNRKA